MATFGLLMMALGLAIGPIYFLIKSEQNYKDYVKNKKKYRCTEFM